MVDWDGLENRCAREGTVGSNPTLSSSHAIAEKPDWPRLAAMTGLAF